MVTKANSCPVSPIREEVSSKLNPNLLEEFSRCLINFWTGLDNYGHLRSRIKFSRSAGSILISRPILMTERRLRGSASAM